MSTPSGTRSVSVEHAITFGLLAAIGLYAVVVGLGYGLFNEGMRVGPGLVPTVVGAGVALVAGWEFVATLRGRRASHTHGIAEVAASVASDLPASPATRAGEAGPAGPLAEATAGGGTASPGSGPDDDVDIFGRTARTRSRQLGVVFTALVIAVLLIPVLGFLVSFFVLSVFISGIVERRPWVPSVVISLVAVLVVYAVFVLFLSVPLPTGLIGIGG
jgi:hypothetical protein